MEGHSSESRERWWTKDPWKVGRRGHLEWWQRGCAGQQQQQWSEPEASAQFNLIS